VTDSEEVADEASESPLNMMLNASPGFARFSFFFGLWAVVIDVINIAIGAYAQGQKVVWAGFLSMGRFADNTYVAHAEQGFTGGDAAFSLIAIAFLGFGCAAIHSQVEGGLAAWLKGLVEPQRWSSLVSTAAGTNATIGAWSLLAGLLFYIGWSINYNTWVDPGVYAVSAPLVAFGIAFQRLGMTDEIDG